MRHLLTRSVIERPITDQATVHMLKVVPGPSDMSRPPVLRSVGKRLTFTEWQVWGVSFLDGSSFYHDPNAQAVKSRFSQHGNRRLSLIYSLAATMDVRRLVMRSRTVGHQTLDLKRSGNPPDRPHVVFR